jgi:uncharacterized membrane protein
MEIILTIIIVLLLFWSALFIALGGKLSFRFFWLSNISNTFWLTISVFASLGRVVLVTLDLLILVLLHD